LVKYFIFSTCQLFPRAQLVYTEVRDCYQQSTSWGYRILDGKGSKTPWITEDVRQPIPTDDSTATRHLRFSGKSWSLN